MPRRRFRLSREAIIDAATAAFYTNGYSETTLACVSGRLAVTDKALYYYFKSKDALYLQTIQVCTERIAALIASIDGTPHSGSDKIRAFFRTMIRQPENLRLYMRDLPAHLEMTEPGQRIRAAQRAHDEILTRWIDEGIADGTIAPGNAEVLWKWNQGGLMWLDDWSRRETEHGPPLRYEDAAIAMLNLSLFAGSRV